ncbi:MAG: histidine kinase [Lachnospiraceae bacterium]|nr:histidine kinase [Lachnospiraceae bacterium]
MKHKRGSLRAKIIAVIISFSLLMAIVAALLGFILSRRLLQENQQQSSYINLQLLGNEIDSDLNAALSFSDRLLLDSQVEEYLERAEAYLKESPVDYNKYSVDVWDHLSEEYRTTPSHDVINRFVVATPEGTCFLHIVRAQTNTTVRIPESIMEAPFFQTLLTAEDYAYIGLVQSPVSRSEHTQILPLLRPVKSFRSSATVGWIYMELSPELLTRHIEKLHFPADSGLYLIFEDQVTCQYENGDFKEAKLPEGVIRYTMPDKGITLALLPSESELRSRSILYVVIIAVVLGLIPFTGALISLMLLRERMRDERTKQALEYRILQSQVNPHFMYNTLNTIKWMATIQGAEGIADMSTALSRLLKNIAKGEEPLIPLRDEKALLDDYFTIMKYRYGGSIELSYEITEEELLDCLVNRFSLQPIVENAIFHGIEPKGSAGRINVRIFEENRKLCIDVADNGVGMDEETLQGLFRNKTETNNDFFRDVGVQNVSERIRFTFGEDYGLYAESVPGEGTTMHYILPKRYQQEEK